MPPTSRRAARVRLHPQTLTVSFRSLSAAIIRNLSVAARSWSLGRRIRPFALNNCTLRATHVYHPPGGDAPDEYWRTSQ